MINILKYGTADTNQDITNLKNANCLFYALQLLKRAGLLSSDIIQNIYCLFIWSRIE